VTWVLDLDGVVWLADQPIPGSPEAIAELRRRGQRVVLATNNSSMTIGDYLKKLERMGVPTDEADLVTSAHAAQTLIQPGERVLIVGAAGVREAVELRRAIPVDEPPADAVMVGWNRAFDYALLTAAMHAVRGGARLIGTNDDATYPMADGVLPGGGALLAAVAYASGVEPIVAGKPYQPMADAITERCGPVDLVVGDRPDTDGRLAERLNAPFGLVLTGVVGKKDLPVQPEPSIIADDLASLVRQAQKP
jgi:4-nitrophenyl phosphatase